MFSFKINKKKQLQTLLSVFVERIFYSCEDICKFDRLSYPAASKPLIMVSFSFLRWLYVSTIHMA